MKAGRFHEYRDLSVLRYEDVELSAVHAQAAAGELHGRTVIVAPTA
ncbi:hypothetical protein [Paractinoplanes globisporus]|uniref:Quinone oxidoreductase n=1 Tax=Paractinoplanes globisporus TaxID=113565 RepID=A0ABW6WIL1_9ACTN|nr:hypothetical protein [Actinoplanes globisporus]